MDKASADKIFHKRNGDKLYASYGPSKFAGRIIWEGIVTDPYDEWQGRYVSAKSATDYVIYEDFQAFMLDVSETYRDALDKVRTLETEIEELKAAEKETAAGRHLESVIKATVPAIAFLAAVAVLSYLVITKPDNSLMTFVFGCVVASACVLYFKNFTTIKLPWLAKE